jgi:hypothetical protein
LISISDDLPFDTEHHQQQAVANSAMPLQEPTELLCMELPEQLLVGMKLPRSMHQSLLIQELGNQYQNYACFCEA